MPARGSLLALALVVLLATGCGRMSFDPLADGPRPSCDAASDASGPDALGEGLLMQFDFEPGTLLRDSARGLDGTCTACPVPAPGPRAGISGAQFFDTKCVHVPAANIAPATFTIALWARQDASPRRTLFGKPENGATSTEDSIEIGGAEGLSGLTIYTSGGSVGAPVPAGSWHHVAGTYDGTQLAVFVDGALIDAQPKSKQTYTPDDVNLGCDYDVGLEDGYFQGALAEVRLYGRALSPAEISALAQP